jgi:hypothetical protein
MLKKFGMIDSKAISTPKRSLFGFGNWVTILGRIIVFNVRYIED